MDWEATRGRFPTLEHTTYLNSCSLGLLPESGREAVEGTFLDEWEDRGAAAWYNGWLPLADELRSAVGDVLGCGTHEVALLPNVSSALTVLASALDHGDRPRVLSHELDFPTVPYQWYTREAATVDLVESPEGIVADERAYEEALGPDVAAVATSHVFYTTGYVQDVARIADAAREAGALSIVDAYQATGQVPTDVKDLGVDALVTGGLKWLLGGPGIAYLYVREGLHSELEPEACGWFGRRDQFDFDVASYEPREDARRYEQGTPSVGSLATGLAGLQLVRDWGQEAIRERCQDLVDDLADRLEDAGLEPRLPDRREDRSAIVTVPLDDPAQAEEDLAAADVVVDHRPGVLRVSPYVYNTPEDHATLVQGIRKAGHI
jgi:selenocysteine lyase/cysteine desulfurase